MKSKLKSFLACAAVIMGCAGQANASLVVKIYQDSFSPVTFTDVSGGVININGILSSAPDFNFSGFNVDSILGASQGQLGGSGTITSLSSESRTLTIEISDDGYTNPGPNYTMGSSSGYTITSNSDASDSFTFQSFASNVLFGTTTASPGALYTGVGNPNPADSFNEAPTPFTQAGGYSLTQRYVWISNGAEDIFQPTGSTIAEAVATVVPEPSTIISLALGGIVLVGCGLRRRKA